jgi:hypothetical protein
MKVDAVPVDITFVCWLANIGQARQDRPDFETVGLV